MKKFPIPVLVLMLAACSPGGQPATQPPDEVVVVTHDSFAVSKQALRTFTDQSGLKVKIVQNGDTGQVVNSAILSAGQPQGDVLFGVDNTFLSRAQQAGVFEDYQAAGAPADLAAAAPGVTPIDTGAVCLNYDRAYFADRPPPRSLADLVKPEFKDLTVVPNPATSSPGLAFLASTVAGQPDWQGYWRALRENGVKVVDGWENAYYQQFSGGSGQGTRPIVVSYSTSPAAEVIFAADRRASAPTAYVDADCFQQVEYAGVLAGARNPQGAREFVDFMLSRTFQDEVGEQMFVYPVRPDATVPPEFQKYAPPPKSLVVLKPDQIADGRDTWIDEWSAIMQ
ncbi:MAG TPA: thiamine ABC transporter substrate-binding protein [Actinomycetota bacterium]|nr:thiamine ABC transporter substrate-binding protein [Actinomycetota bacterium]